MNGRIRSNTGLNSVDSLSLTQILSDYWMFDDET